ncbi:glycosyltransferase family 4 protein [Actinomadura flavalba]|uniref:glycosyltransferase family 4 protein n=1 Tax=Actinomadura flavalba TaxID=1120938 RepID=UPI00035F058F|nr:glycosyltransferase family 4 protein [Actinomadura flavalba]
MHRVLWVTEHYPPSKGGMAESCDRIVRGLRGAGVAVDVAHLTRRARPWRVEREQGGLLITAPLEDDPEHALRRLLGTLARSAGEYTHVVAFGGTYAVLAAPVYAAVLDVPLVTLLRGNDLDTGLFSLRRRPTLTDALRASARVCTVARSHVPLVRALAPDAPVTFVANSVDTGQWEVLPSERAAARAWRAGHVEAGRRTVGLVGVLKNKKGIGFFLDALRVSGHAGRFHLLLVGEVEDGVPAWLAERPEVHHTFLPFLERYELPRVYASCDVVALPSFYDGMPNVALEAAALGVPLLASDAGGLADVVDDRIGFPFAAGDPHACRAALDAAARLPDAELAKLGAAAADRIARDFTPAAETAGYLAVLRETAR